MFSALTTGSSSALNVTLAPSASALFPSVRETSAMPPTERTGQKKRLAYTVYASPTRVAPPPPLKFSMMASRMSASTFATAPESGVMTTLKKTLTLAGRKIR